MIDARKALSDLAATPGAIIAVPKAQLEELLGELLSRQERATPAPLSLFPVAAVMPA